MTSHRDTRCLDLSGGEPPAAERLKTKLTKGDVSASFGDTTNAAFLLLAKLSFLWR
jgi:hypothetical protein